MKKKLICPYCGYTWTYGFFEWAFKAPFHWFNFFMWRDKRYTKCPECQVKSWIYRA